MANTKISQLPEYSGNPTGGYSVFNNSGETTTYKIKTRNLFGDTNTIGSAAKYPFVVGSGNTLNNILQVAIGYNNTMTGGVARDDGKNANLIVGNNNSLTDAYSSNNITVGQNNTISTWNSLTVGQSNNIGYGLDGIIVGSNNSSSTEYSNVFGQYNSNTSQGGMVVGQNNNAQGYAISYESPFIHGYNNSTVMSHFIAILGGRFNQITGIMYDTNARPYYDAIVGGEYNYIGTYITGSTIVGAGYSTISGTSGTTKYSVINGGMNNTISSSPYSAIIGGTGNTITSLEKVVMLGTNGRSATASNTTHTENLHIFRTPSETVQTLTSGTTFTMNLDNGAKGQFVLTGASTINITNVRDGASFMIKTQTTAAHAITWTATGGYTFLFDDGGSQPGNTSTDIFNFDVFGNVIYGTRRHNFT